jgi:hypothetical protein
MPRQQRLSIVLALACALFVRALVPAGWMPAASGGAFAIEPCPAADTARMAHMAHQHGSPSKSQHDGECAFNPLLAGFTAASAAPQVGAPLLAPEVRVTPAAAPRFKTGPPAPPPPATGPPALA